MTIIDLTGKVFTRWTVLEISKTKPNKSPHNYWLCVCECGVKKLISGPALRNGTSRSCGCLKENLNSLRKLTQDQLKLNKAITAAIKDKTPARREQKRLTQMRYVVSPKALLAHLRRWLKKRKNEVKLTEEEFLEFRKRPCTGCGKVIEGLVIGFSLIKPRRCIELSNMVPMCGVCKLIKPKSEFSVLEFSKNILRRFWKRTPMVATVMQKARKGRGLYQCASCLNIFSKSDVQVDHRIPVVDPVVGFVNLDTYALRLFCDDSNLDLLCKPCHSIKTSKENLVRSNIRALSKGIKNES